MDTDNNTEEVNPNTEKVKITKAQQYTYLTFFCPYCLSPHSIPVTTPEKETDNTWPWNQSTTKPTIYNHCIHFKQPTNCQTWINNGFIIGYGAKTLLLPITDWPTLTPNPKTKELLHKLRIQTLNAIEQVKLQYYRDCANVNSQNIPVYQKNDQTLVLQRKHNKDVNTLVTTNLTNYLNSLKT